MTPGENLKAAREAKGWTRTDLAQASGVSRANILNIEANGQSPTLRTIEMLAAALEMSVPELLGIQESDLAAGPDDVELLNIATKLPPDRKRWLLESARMALFGPAMMPSAS